VTQFSWIKKMAIQLISQKINFHNQRKNVNFLWIGQIKNG